MKTIRKTITFPLVVENQIIKYQEANGIPTFTGAMLELVRIGLSHVKDDAK
jgi:hypothetical protein